MLWSRVHSVERRVEGKQRGKERVKKMDGWLIVIEVKKCWHCDHSTFALVHWRQGSKPCRSFDCQVDPSSVQVHPDCLLCIPKVIGTLTAYIYFTCKFQLACYLVLSFPNGDVIIFNHWKQTGKKCLIGAHCRLVRSRLTLLCYFFFLFVFSALLCWCHNGCTIFPQCQLPLQWCF